MPDTIFDWIMLQLLVALVLCVVGYCHLGWQTKTQPKHFGSPEEISEAMRVRILLAMAWPLVVFVMALTIMIALIFYISEKVDEVTAFKAASNNFSLENLGTVLAAENDELIDEDDLSMDDRVALEALRRDIARFETTDGLDS